MLSVLEPRQSRLGVTPSYRPYIRSVLTKISSWLTDVIPQQLYNTLRTLRNCLSSFLWVGSYSFTLLKDSTETLLVTETGVWPLHSSGPQTATQFPIQDDEILGTSQGWTRFNPLNSELNPICYLLALLGAHHFLHVSRIRVKSLNLRLLMSCIYGTPILDVSRSHTTTQHSG